MIRWYSAVQIGISERPLHVRSSGMLLELSRGRWHTSDGIASRSRDRVDPTSEWRRGRTVKPRRNPKNSAARHRETHRSSRRFACGSLWRSAAVHDSERRPKYTTLLRSGFERTVAGRAITAFRKQARVDAEIEIATQAKGPLRCAAIGSLQQQFKQDELLTRRAIGARFL